MHEFLQWVIAFWLETISALANMPFVAGVSILGLCAAFYVLSLLIQNLLFRG